MLSTILVPLDGSPMADQALPVAEQLARAGSSKLVLVRSVQAFTFPGVDARNAQTVALAEAQKYLDTIASRLTAASLTVETGVPYGEAATEILHEIGIRKADLIVMAPHGRSGAGRWLYGSVADEVLRPSAVPVVLVPPSTEPAPLLEPLRQPPAETDQQDIRAPSAPPVQSTSHLRNLRDAVTAQLTERRISVAVQEGEP